MSSPLASAFGRIIQQLRKRKPEFTAADMEYHSGIRIERLSALESGAEPTLTEIQGLASAFDIPAGALAQRAVDVWLHPESESRDEFTPILTRARALELTEILVEVSRAHKRAVELLVRSARCIDNDGADGIVSTLIGGAPQFRNGWLYASAMNLCVLLGINWQVFFTAVNEHAKAARDTRNRL